MSQTWHPNPHFKLTVGGTDYIDDLATSIKIVRPENNVSFLVLDVDDYKSRSYEGIFDAFTTVSVSLRFGTGTWTKVFSGTVCTCAPKLTMRGQVMEVGAWGQGNALVATHCDESYGLESIDNNTVDTPNEIVEDLIDEHVNKEFGGAASGWALTHTEAEDVHAALSVTFLNSKYDNNFTNINRLCDVVNAYAQGLAAPEVSVHWHVDPNANFYMKKIDASHVAVAGNAYDWPRYWKGSQSASTIRVNQDMILYDFRKNVEEYANRIILSSQFRLPSEDFICEDHGGAALWGDDGNVTLTDSATSIVGSHSLLAEPNAGVGCDYWYPGGSTLAGDAAAAQPDVIVNDASGFAVGDNVRLWDNTPLGESKIVDSIAGNTLTMTVNLTNAYQVANNAGCYHNAAWNLTAIGSRKTVPTLNFWARVNIDKGATGAHIRLYTALGSYYGMYAALDSAFISAVDEWTFISVPVGPYFMVGQDPAAKGRWVGAGVAEDWANINWINVSLPNDNAYDVYLDDLHFAGIVVREAYDAAEIAAHGSYQKIVRNDVAANDTLIAADDSGTIARLTRAELLRRSQTPIVGMARIPLAIDLLPGQTVHVHAQQKKDNTYRIDMDMRVKELTDEIVKVGGTVGASTVLNLTSDVTNTHAFAVPDMYGLLKQYAGAMWHGEARNLKGGGIDTLIPRLTKAY